MQQDTERFLLACNKDDAGHWLLAPKDGWLEVAMTVPGNDVVNSMAL